MAYAHLDWKFFSESFIPAVGIKYPAKQDTVYKIPITSTEYFLIEIETEIQREPV